jgi:hypothetical protein
MGWVVNTTPRPLYPRKRPGTHCIGGWACRTDGLNGCGKSRLHRDTIPRTIQPAASRYTDWAIQAYRCISIYVYKMFGAWGSGIDSRSCHWIFQWHIFFQLNHGPGVDSAPRENEYQGFPWGERRPVREADNLPPYGADVKKSRSLNSSRPLWDCMACNGCALLFFNIKCLAWSRYHVELKWCDELFCIFLAW